VSREPCRLAALADSNCVLPAGGALSLAKCENAGVGLRGAFCANFFAMNERIPVQIADMGSLSSLVLTLRCFLREPGFAAGI